MVGLFVGGTREKGGPGPLAADPAGRKKEVHVQAVIQMDLQALPKPPGMVPEAQKAAPCL